MASIFAKQDLLGTDATDCRSACGVDEATVEEDR